MRTINSIRPITTPAIQSRFTAQHTCTTINVIIIIILFIMVQT